MTTEYTELMDIEAIKKLRILYSHLLDTKDLDRLTGLFTEDAVCNFGGGRGIWTGREELRRNWAGVHTEFDTNRAGSYPFLHAVTNHWVELTGPNSAEGRCYLLDWVTAQVDRNPLLVLGIYADIYRKESGTWRISYCRIDYVWPERDVVGGAPGGLRAVLEANNATIPG